MIKKFNPKRKQTGAVYQIQYIEPMVVKDEACEYKYVQKSEDVFHLLQDLQDATKEKFVAVYLNSRNRVLCIEVVHVGSTTETTVDVATLLRSALLVNAQAIVVSHNHPSGDTEPSIADRNITSKIREACKILGLTLIDHIIIGDNKYYSFSEHGVL